MRSPRDVRTARLYDSLLAYACGIRLAFRAIGASANTPYFVMIQKEERRRRSILNPAGGLWIKVTL